MNTWIEASRIPLPYVVVCGLLVFLYAAFADAGFHMVAALILVAGTGFYLTAPSPKHRR